MGMTSPACAVGSGKFGTPCARMHWAYLSSGPPPAAAPDGRLGEPQAVIAAAEITVTNPACKRRAFGVPRMLRVCTWSVAPWLIGWLQLYALACNLGGTRAVTPLLHGVRDSLD